MNPWEGIASPIMNPAQAGMLSPWEGIASPIETPNAPSAPNFLQNISSDFNNRANEIKDIFTNAPQYQTSVPSLALQTGGQVAGGLGDLLLKEPIKSAYNSLPDSISSPLNSAAGKFGELLKSGAQSTANIIDSTETGKSLGDMLLNNPNISKNAEALGNLAMVNPMADIISGGANLAKEGIANIAENGIGNSAINLGKNIASGNPDAAVLPSKTFTPQEYHSAINQTYKISQASREPFYNFMNKTVAGQTMDVAPAIQAAQKTIEEIGKDAFHPARAILGRLENFVESYKDNPQMPIADAVEMKQDINSFFNPKKFSQGAKAPFFQVGKVLDNGIQQAEIDNPTFAAAKELSDKNYVNNYALPFSENKLLEPFWKTQDYYAAKSMDKGLAEYLPDETKLRARTMLENIKTPEHLDAVTRVLPPEMAAALRQQILKNITSGNGMYRLGQLGNIIGDYTRPGVHLKGAIMGQPYTDAQKALMAASKNPSPSLNPSYEIWKSMLDKSNGGGYQ